MTQSDMLQAIIADPDDDFPRLAFADWLEERGDPRGEFIRLQYALRDPALEARQRHEAAVREKELLAEHETEWLGGLAPLQGACTFQRGFPEQLTLSAAAFLDGAGRLLPGTTVRGVTFRQVGDLLPRLVSSPVIENLARLSFPDAQLSDADVRVLADSRFLTGLTDLDLTANRVGISGARTLAASPNLPNLRLLVLDHNPIEDLGLDALAASSRFGKLTSLSVQACDLHAGGMKSLISTPLFGRLGRLALGGNPIGNSGLQTLARARPPASLTDLVLHHTQINSLGLKHLTTSAVVGKLERLDLRHNHITDGGAQSLVDSPYLTALKHLDLRGNNLSCDARHELKVRFGAAVVY